MTKSNSNNPLQQLASWGQSVWYDNISRGLIRSGALKKLIDEDGVVGITSNPSIFEKAMTTGADYDDAFRELVGKGDDVKNIFQALSIEDIGHAADLLRDVYERTQGVDGYVSIEVSPELARDAAGTIDEARAFHKLLKRPNIMVKVPGTPECVPAIEQLTREGISVNVTLLFGIGQYQRVIDAYLRGLEARSKAGDPLDHIHSVASFFVSRVDTLIDKRLDDANVKNHATPVEAKALRGKAAVANARIAYELFEKMFRGQRWEALHAKGATMQRPLWASTGVKDPAYPDTLYVDSLIGPHTVNTMPQATLDAYRDHGHPAANRIREDIAGAHDVVRRLGAMGIALEEVAEELQIAGVQLFADAFSKLRQALTTKRDTLLRAVRENQKTGTA